MKIIERPHVGVTGMSDMGRIADIAFTVALAPHYAMTSIPYCARMDDDFNRVCVVHADRSDCPDAFVTEMNGGYDLMVYDGGSSAIEIAFRPWSGARLPQMDH